MYYNGKEIKKVFPKFYFFNEINECKIDGKKFIFKVLPKDIYNEYVIQYFYNDLIIKYVCDEVGIDCCDIDLITTNKKTGVIVPDYRKNDCKYINGQDILEEYLNYLEQNELIEQYLGEKVNYSLNQDLREYLINQMNNLETIWDALNYHYRNDNEYIRQDKINKIINELCKRFSFDYLVMQTDRHERNWEVEEKNDSVQLVPLFDNEMTFNYFGFVTEMKVEKTDNIFGIKEIEKYLKYSFDHFRNQFMNIYKFLTPEKLEEIITNVEKERGFQFPIIYKKNLLQNYQLNYNEISEIIQRINGGLKR